MDTERDKQPFTYFSEFKRYDNLENNIVVHLGMKQGRRLAVLDYDINL